MVMLESVTDIAQPTMDSLNVNVWRPLPLGMPNAEAGTSSALDILSKESFKLPVSEAPSSGPLTPLENPSSTEGSVCGDETSSNDSASTAPSEHGDAEPELIAELKPETIIPKVVVEDESNSTPTVNIRAPEVYDEFAPASTRLRYMIKNSDHIIKCPGVYDGLSARIAIDCGFEGMYMTGAGTTASRLGQADLGIAHLYDMRTNAEMIANLRPDGPPLIADMDTGYGGPLVVAKSLQEYHRAGVAAFHIEDQIMNKRCGHLAGKEVVDTETYIQRIKACIIARKQLRSDIIIIARTDALQSKGFDDCIERLKRARDEGADMGILEGVKTKEEAARAAKLLAPWPLCYNSVENGHSPLITADECQAMGYRIIIYSFASISPAYVAIKSTFEWLKETGTTGSSVTPKTIFNVCGLADSMVIDEASGGTAFSKGV